MLNLFALCPPASPRLLRPFLLALEERGGGGGGGGSDKFTWAKGARARGGHRRSDTAAAGGVGDGCEKDCERRSSL